MVMRLGFMFRMEVLVAAILIAVFMCMALGSLSVRVLMGVPVRVGMAMRVGMFMHMSDIPMGMLM
jgi:hypothetical protein